MRESTSKIKVYKNFKERTSFETKSRLSEQYVGLKQRSPFLTNNLWCELNTEPKSSMGYAMRKRMEKIPDDWRFKILTEEPSRSIMLFQCITNVGAKKVIIPLPLKHQAGGPCQIATAVYAALQLRPRSLGFLHRD